VPNFYVPERFQPALNRIVELADAEIESIRQALASAEPSLDVGSLTAHVQSSLKKEVPEIEDIIRTLVSLNNARMSADVSVERFVRDIPRRVTERKGKAFDRTGFERRLVALLNVESLTISARAFDIQHEYERVFVSARIVTDIRTVFDNTGTNPVGAMIVHNLNIKYSKSGTFKEFFIALDDGDVAKIKTILDRAETKSSSLEAALERSGIRYFESK
jgi:hypothetical protein